MEGLLYKMQDQFEKMAQTVVNEIDQLGARIETLEKQVEGLTNIGTEEWLNLSGTLIHYEKSYLCASLPHA